MAINVYRENDANLDLLKGKTIGVMGYGNQGSMRLPMFLTEFLKIQCSGGSVQAVIEG